MKKKFNFWLQIVTICLCICAIAVGVYSVTTASITAGGKVAFTAHNCKVELTGYIYGHAAGDVHDGLPVAEGDAEPLTKNNAPITVEGGVNTAVQSTISIGENRWFSDMASTDGKPADIVIGITVKNITIYDITVTANLDDVTYPQSQVTVSCDTDTADLKQNESVTFEFTLSFNTNANSSYTAFGLTNLVIPIEAEKYIEPEVTLLHNDNDGFGWHIKMGTIPEGYASAGASLRWKPFAVSATGSNFEAFDNSNKPEINKTYYFVSEYILLKSYFGQGDTTSSSNNYGLDYGTSLAQIVTNGTSDGSIYATFGLEGNEVYSMITPRDLLGETYVVVDYSEGGGPSGGTTNAISNQTLWLMSLDEYEFIDDATTANMIDEDFPHWWLRTPHDIKYVSADTIIPFTYYSSAGSAVEVMNTFDTYGIRPCFQMTILAG